MSYFKPYTPQDPCAVCLTGSKGCSHTDDGMVCCRGEPARPDEWVQLWERGNGFRGYRRADDLGRNSWRKAFDHLPQFSRPARPRAGKTPPAATAPAPAPAEPPIDWATAAAAYAANLTPALENELSDILGLPVAALKSIAPLGYCPGEVLRATDGELIDLGCWTFPERDPAGNIIGLSGRWRAGCGPGGRGDKQSFPRARRGLTLPDGWRDAHPALPLLDVEGQSCVAALVAVGVPCFGRSSNAGDADKIAELVATLPAGRTIVIMGENDARPHKTRKGETHWPGRDGMQSVARTVARLTGRTVFTAFPPPEHKDCRDWVLAMAASDRFPTTEAARDAVIDHIYDTATQVDPPAAGGKDVTDAPTTTPRPRGSTGVVVPECAPSAPAGSSSPVCSKGADSDAACGTCGPCKVRLYRSRPGTSVRGVSNTGEQGLDRKTPPRPQHPLWDATASLIGPAPEHIPCKYLKTHPREGVHPSTDGKYDLIRTTCGRCRPCQDKIRYREKIRHTSAALAAATHRWNGSEDQWNAFKLALRRLRKNCGLKKAVGYTRIVTADPNSRVTFVSIPRDAGIPEDYLTLELDLSPVTPEQAARRVVRAIDEIPHKLPRHTRRILSNAAWKAAGITPPSHKTAADRAGADELPKAKLFADLGAQPLHGPDLAWAKKVAEDEGAWAKEIDPSHYRIAGRLLVGTDGDQELGDALFRRWFAMSVEQARLSRERAAELARVRRERHEAAERAMREADRAIREMRAQWAGREDEAGAWYKTFLWLRREGEGGGGEGEGGDGGDGSRRAA